MRILRIQIEENKYILNVQDVMIKEGKDAEYNCISQVSQMKVVFKETVKNVRILLKRIIGVLSF